MFSVVRVLVAAVAMLMMLGGIVVIAAGEPAGGLWVMALGAAGLIAVALERTRYRSQAAEHGADAIGPGGGEPAIPGPPFQPTDERFVDPTTGRRMRVYVDPATGERRYHADA